MLCSETNNIYTVDEIQTFGLWVYICSRLILAQLPKWYIHIVFFFSSPVLLELAPPQFSGHLLPGVLPAWIINKKLPPIKISHSRRSTGDKLVVMYHGAWLAGTFVFFYFPRTRKHGDLCAIIFLPLVTRTRTENFFSFFCKWYRKSFVAINYIQIQVL